jgi:RHS repeat-associated protein
MEPSQSQVLCEPLLAAMPQLKEKLHQGVPSNNPAPHPRHEVLNSTVAIGLRAALHLDAVRSRYTGKERDSESGLDEFGARYYASTTGRFMIPDWAAKPTNVPYASFGDPQSLNLYSYAHNNPLTYIDHDGHCFVIFRFSERLCNSIDGYGWVSDARRDQMIRDDRDWLRHNSNFDVERMKDKQIVDVYNAARSGKDSVISEGQKFVMARMAALPGPGNPTSPNQMNQQVQKGQAPNSVDRVDSPRFPFERPHIEFTDGNALNNDGTWKHGGRQLTNAEKEWISQNGWTLPQ